VGIKDMVEWLGGYRRMKFMLSFLTCGEPSGTVGLGTVLQAEFYNPSSRTMALGSTHPLTEMSIRNISWGVKVAGL
jgi:hypothetical protein